MGRLLARHSSKTSLALIDAVLDWTIELGRATRGAPLPADVELPGIHGVVAHRDLGSWNIVTDGADFTVVDWESARADSPPLGDALYFLTDALGVMAGARTQQERYRFAVLLHSGRVSLSRVFFRGIRRAADALELSPSSVGPLAMLCWVGHSTSRDSRVARLSDTAIRAEEPYMGRLAGPWRADPALGADWLAFMEAGNV